MRSSSVLALVLAAAPLAAQEPQPDPLPRRLGFSRPTPDYDIETGGQHGLGGMVGLVMRRPPPPGPPPRGARLSLSGRYGITGSRDATLALDAPAWWRDWRVMAQARTERMLRTPYLGPDNQTLVEDSLRDRYGIEFYRHALLRTGGYLTVHRRIAGPLWFLAAGQMRHYRTSSLKQTPTLYERDVAAAAVPDTARYRGREVRAGLVWDTRDDWVVPAKGAMLEAVVSSGRLTGDAPAGSMKYRRYLLAAREFLPLDASRRTVLALRQRVALASDTLPFFLAYEQLTTWAPTDGVLGKRSIRLHGKATVLASNVAYVSVEIRRIMLPPDWPERERRLWAQVFADYGQVWEPNQDASQRRTAWTVGVGARLQRGRTFLTGMDIGWTNEGLGLAFTSGFAF